MRVYYMINNAIALAKTKLTLFSFVTKCMGAKYMKEQTKVPQKYKEEIYV